MLPTLAFEKAFSKAVGLTWLHDGVEVLMPTRLKLTPENLLIVASIVQSSFLSRSTRDAFSYLSYFAQCKILARRLLKHG